MPWWIPLISAGIGLVGQFFGSRAASNAAREASEAQQDATLQALALQERMYEQSRADMLPLLQAEVARAQMGLQSQGTLMGLMGMSGTAGAGVGAEAPGLYQGFVNTDYGDQVPGRQAVYVGDDPLTRDHPLYSGYGYTRDRGDGQPGAIGPGAALSPEELAERRAGSGGVFMQSRNGEIAWVPNEYVDVWRSRGAVVLPNAITESGEYIWGPGYGPTQPAGTLGDLARQPGVPNPYPGTPGIIPGPGAPQPAGGGRVAMPR